MGADFKEFKKGEEIVRNMEDAGKAYLAHHLNNSLCGLIGALDCNDVEKALKAAWHMVDDLNRVGINSGGKRKPPHLSPLPRKGEGVNEK